MRVVRIAAFTVAAVLACVVISQVFSIEPAPPPQDSSADFDSQAGPPPTVPPPPPLPGSPAAQPPSRRPSPARMAAVAQPRLIPPQNLPQDVSPAGAKPSIWTGDSKPVDDEDAGAAPAPVETASVEVPKAPVIVVPRERPKEDRRGVRWLKAVGHALGIGGARDPAEQAFR